MKSKYASLLIILLLININVIGQENIYEKIIKSSDAIGRIWIADSLKTSAQPIGSAFVAGSNHDVVTCSHVVISDTLFFQPIDSDGLFRIKAKLKIPCLDVAYLERTAGENNSYLEFGNFDKVQPGDSVYYIGWDKRVDKYIIWSSLVSSKGITFMNDNCSVEYIEYSGQAIPGYSGGPVFNNEGKVIGIVAEGLNIVGIRGDNKYVNRAFSIDILKLIDTEIQLSSSFSSKNGNKLIELIKKPTNK